MQVDLDAAAEPFAPAFDAAQAVPRRSSGYPDEPMKTNGSSPNGLIELATPVERAFLLAVDTDTDDGWTAEDSLAELASLAVTAGADVVGAEWQNRRHVDPELVRRQGQGRGAAEREERDRL